MAAVVSSSGQQRVSQRYSAYGVPFAAPAGDLDADGDCDGSDSTILTAWIAAPLYDVRGDLDLDGDLDATDQSTLTGTYSGVSLGRGKLSRGVDLPAGGVRKGYAGYEHDGALLNMSFMHVRNRVYMAEIGRWTRRDPLGYVDGVSLYEYVSGGAINQTDPLGLERSGARGSSSPDAAGGFSYVLCILGCNALNESMLSVRNCYNVCRCLLLPPAQQVIAGCLRKCGPAGIGLEECEPIQPGPPQGQSPGNGCADNSWCSGSACACRRENDNPGDFRCCSYGHGHDCGNNHNVCRSGVCGSNGKCQLRDNIPCKSVTAPHHPIVPGDCRPENERCNSNADCTVGTNCVTDTGNDAYCRKP